MLHPIKQATSQVVPAAEDYIYRHLFSQKMKVQEGSLRKGGSLSQQQQHNLLPPIHRSSLPEPMLSSQVKSNKKIPIIMHYHSQKALKSVKEGQKEQPTQKKFSIQTMKLQQQVKAKTERASPKGTGRIRVGRGVGREQVQVRIYNGIRLIEPARQAPQQFLALKLQLQENLKPRPRQKPSRIQKDETETVSYKRHNPITGWHTIDPELADELLE